MAALAGNGDVIFTPPVPVERVPLRSDKAYGGADLAALEKYGDPYEELRPFLSPDLAVPPAEYYTYPRNGCGTGYIFEATVEAVNRLVLPNLEDPLDLLTPKRLLVGQPGLWPRMPIPHALGWLAPTDFPRMAYLGIPPLHEPFDGPLPEAARGRRRTGCTSPRRCWRSSACGWRTGRRWDSSLGLMAASSHPGRDRGRNKASAPLVSSFLAATLTGICWPNSVTMMPRFRLRPHSRNNPRVLLTPRLLAASPCLPARSICRRTGNRLMSKVCEITPQMPDGANSMTHDGERAEQHQIPGAEARRDSICSR